MAPSDFQVWIERAPERSHAVAVPGGTVRVYDHGARGDPVLFLLNGGPGLPCDYLREPHLPLVELGFRVVVHDQLGTGASDHPDDPGLWTIERYAAEVEAVMAALGLEKVHFLGHSWGGWCGIEWAATFPGRVASMILVGTAADIPHLVGEIERHRAALGPETVAMMQRFEALGRLDHPAYKAAIDLLEWRHFRRLRERPLPSVRSHEGFNEPIFVQIQGPNEFLYTGSLRHWNRLDAMERFDWPTLVVQGRHDALTPACAMRMHQRLPRGEIRIFPNSSHSPFYEEPQAYRALIVGFLRHHAATG